MEAEEIQARTLRAVPGAADGSSPPTPETLLSRAARGDTDAFGALYDQLAPRVYGLVRRVLRDPSQAEEVTQEVFVTVWQEAPRFDPARGSASGWISTMAHRRAVDRVRSAEAQKARDIRIAARSSGRPHDQVAEQVEIRLEHERIRGCLGSLTDLQRESITLAYYSGYTYREVAELLRLPVGTVKTRMRDGLGRLSDCMGNES